MTDEKQTREVGGAAGNAAPPPHGPRLHVVVPVAVLVVAALAAGAVWSEFFRSLGDRVYHAIARPAASKSEAGAEAESTTQYYTCGMHPWVILPKPGDCPICHMKLVPLDPAKFTSEVAINPIMTQNIGVRVAPVVAGPVTRIVRTVGTVDYDETLLSDVSLKIAGWVEKLYINATGQAVEKGQPLLDIYSPDLYSAEEEYLVALKKKESHKASAPSAPADVAAMDSELLESARKRLEYFDVPAEQVRELEKAGKAAKTLGLRSPLGGTVIAKNVFEGQKVDPGMSLLRIADLSKVWIMVTVYEYQLPFVEVGQKAVMTLPYLPGRTFEGRVAYIYPYLNPDLRQAKVRLEFDNPGLLLKPGMFATVELRRTLAGNRPLVPREAVTDTGVRQVAFVSLGEGRFEPREVKVGAEAEGGMVEILEGLKPGENVVTSGQFLLDSEARLREALAKMVKGTPAVEPKAGAAPGGAELAPLPKAAAKALTAVLDAYFRIGSKLSGDTAEGIAAPARQAAEGIDALVKVEMPGGPHFWHQHAETAQVRAKALELAEVKDIEQARDRYADLSAAFRQLVVATGVPPTYGKEIHEFHCPMYREKTGGVVWLQPAGEVRNPYGGKKMLECFDTKRVVPVAGARPAAAGAPAPTQKPGAMPPMPGM